MALCPGDSTEWEDIHRKLGNFAPKKKEVPQRVLDAAFVEAVEQMDPLAQCSLGHLDALEDDIEEDVLARCRAKRLAELKQAQQAAKFGTVGRVTKANFVHEVTEASAEGVWILVFLYYDQSEACQIFELVWEKAARRFPQVKFMRGVACEVIPDYPDSAVPAVVLYKDKDCQQQLIGLDTWGGRQCDVDCVEWVLAGYGVVDTELPEDPREALKSSRQTHGATRNSAVRRKKPASESGSDEDSTRETNAHDDRCFTSKVLSSGFRR